MSAVQICNLALSSLGSKSTISSLEENSIEARVCKLHYDISRDKVLEDYEWRFASKDVALAVIGTAPCDWLYQYAYPSDCLKARRIVSLVRTDIEIPFDIKLGEDNVSKVIVTDTESAILRYTAAAIETTLFSATFKQALAFRLALDIAIPLTRDRAIADLQNNLYFEAIGKAKSKDGNEVGQDEPRQAAWITNRG
jgi:hypothetical protein